MNATYARLVDTLKRAEEPLAVHELSSLMDCSSGTVRTYLRLLEADITYSLTKEASVTKKKADKGRGVFVYSLKA